MSEISDAAEMAKAIRDEVVRWPGVEGGSRQIGTPEHSTVDFWTEDGRLFVVTVEGTRPAGDTQEEDSQ